MKRILRVILIVIGVLIGLSINYVGYHNGFEKGYRQGYNMALDTCASILKEPVKHHGMVAKLIIQDSTVTHVFYLRKKTSRP